MESELEMQISKSSDGKKIQERFSWAPLAYIAILALVGYTHGGEPRKKSSVEEWQENERNRYCTKDGKRTIW